MNKIETLQTFEKKLKENADNSFAINLQKNCIFKIEKCNGVANEMKSWILLTVGKDVNGKRISVNIISSKNVYRSSHWRFRTIKFEIDWKAYRETLNEQKR